MKKGNLTVHTQDIFPIIKKFLYTDHDIFLRELISNATDATQKIKILASRGDYQEELGNLAIEVKLDKKAKTLSILDRGIGMTEDEIDRYINQIAFSSAEEFIEKYQKSGDPNQLIGHFGLGFYSAFMVSDKVEIHTKSYLPDAPAVKWECSGNTEYKVSASKKKERGTEIILHISGDFKEYLEEYKIEQLLEKYCRFMPVEIQFGTEKVKEKVEGEKDKDGKDQEIEVEKPKIINNTNPLWMQKPTEIKPEDYKKFYSELYPFTPEPLFWIHLNVDFPFHLTGILYFPKITNAMEVQRNKIWLYSNQVFVTDNVTDIVPEFLTLLHGVIDSPDIPLNVSRSSLQSDPNVKKISTYIVKKVSERLQEIFKENRVEFEEKWDEISIFVKYGMLSDEKFAEKAEKFLLLKDTDKKTFTIEEYKEKTNINQQDKDNNLVWLYTSDQDVQYPYIELAQNKGYNVLVFNEILDSHFINLLEQKAGKVRVKRIDSASVEQLIDKGEKKESVLSKEALDELTSVFVEAVANEKNVVKTEPLSPQDPPLVIIEDEFSRRMKEMSKVSGWGGMGELPDRYEVILNSNHPIAKKLLIQQTREDKVSMAKQLYDLGRLAKNMLKGKELNDFIGRSFGYMGG